MRSSVRLACAFYVGLALAARPAVSWADEYDDSQSHPLRVVAYALHPLALVVEWTLARPFHALVSATPTLEYIFGHHPHPPLFLEPQPLHDYGVTRKVPMPEPAMPKKMTSSEPVAERISVKEVVVEKPVIREVAKVVEVEKVIFPDVAFEFNSAQLTDLGKGRVFLVAQKLREKAPIEVVIEGHTDHIGSGEYNRRLGLLRAEVVKQELTRLGVDPSRMSVTSAGETRPLIDQDTSWARAVNRRAEFKVTAP
ncbi:MAG TPA: OmpA family protein [Candidatus Acidoferrales bacterium]|nr:OmpA family protein [Candidatus Acidoferrales bacterium]